MMRKYAVVSAVMCMLALSMNSISWAEEDSTAKEEAAVEPVEKLPPIPDAMQDGVVCLLPDMYHRNLDGTIWRLTSLNEETPPDKLEITIGFHNGTVSGYAGCNSYVGTFVNPKEILFGVKGISTTNRKCETAVCPSFEAGGTWEEKYLGALKDMAKVEKTDAEMKLFDGEGKLVMTFAALK